MIYFETKKIKEYKQFFDKHKYIFGLQRDVRLKKQQDYEYKTEWYSMVKVFTNFNQALEWYLVGKGVRQLGDDYDKEVFEECYGRVGK